MRHPPPRPPAQAFACVARAWQAHEAELRGYLRHGLRDDHAAEDVLQDTFVKAVREGEAFCALHNPRAWLFQVARNVLIDRLRAARPAEPLDEASVPAPDPRADAPEPVDALGQCVERTLLDLAPADADILRACDLEGMTQREFAARHGITLAAAKTRLLRARLRLRERITQACRVRFDDETGRVCGHDGRAGNPTPAMR